MADAEDDAVDVDVLDDSPSVATVVAVVAVSVGDGQPEVSSSAACIVGIAWQSFGWGGHIDEIFASSSKLPKLMLLLWFSRTGDWSSS